MNLKQSRILLLALLLALGMILAACGSSDDASTDSDSGSDNEDTEETDTSSEDGSSENASGSDSDFSVAMVTDVGGVDDKSFNQSAWEGLKKFGNDNGLEEGNGYTYLQSNEATDYAPNLNRLVQQGYNLIYGIGYKLHDDIENVAKQNPDTQFSIVDDVVEQPNVASITFKEHQGSFLVGVAAAKKTKTDKIGFVGGVDGFLINKFEAGFEAGAKSVNPDIEVEVQYAGGFDQPAKGKSIASNMYNSGIDIIYHASGGTGVGVFNQAKDIKQSNPEEDVWVIGVDRDQYEEGQVGDNNVTFTSMIKRVDIAVADVAEQAMNGEFPGGEQIAYGLSDDAVSVAETNEEAYTDEIKQAVQEWKEKITSGEVEVPQDRDELATYLENL
ncbi:BMP family protein [Pontibacillus sp. ALD_SL1]|uniref:BMP family lipoprotein n=1 Tax=Pontibacillus sp. ALD_SL1 TaxID=2777185 RepID=UPI001A97529E|nr:BMP family protein [Pontibacillus sp. ALD_SL1]